jgi:hypothetical protein
MQYAAVRLCLIAPETRDHLAANELRAKDSISLISNENYPQQTALASQFDGHVKF